MIQLLQGSIFNTKCDLLIIPCNNMGGVTSSIRHELSAHALPTFSQVVFPGDVVFFPTAGNFANASMIGYAATVDADRKESTRESLKLILGKIRKLCIEQSIEIVNIPLLGTGAGGLTYDSSYEIMSSYFQEEKSIILRVYTINPDFYHRISLSSASYTDAKKLKNPRVFISYTGADPQNSQWVKSLAVKLRGNGVNARLDRFHLKAGNDLPQWMTNELMMADKVLLICDRYYADKADNRKGGVGWETMIIQGEMSMYQEQSKYIAIIRDKNIDKSLPIYVKSKYALNWAEEDAMEREFNDLLFNLFDCDVEPELGEIPDFIKTKLLVQSS